MARACIFGIVIYKLSYWQEPSLIVLFNINKSLKISLYIIFLLFCLAINLNIKSSKEPLFNIKQVTKQ